MSFFKKLNKEQDEAVEEYKEESRIMYKAFLISLSPLLKDKMSNKYKTFIKKELKKIGTRQNKLLDNIIYKIVKRRVIKGNFAKQIMRERWSDIHYSDRIWKEKKKLEKILIKEIRAGMDNDKREFLLRKISKKLDTATYNAERLINTELTYAMARSEIKLGEIYGKKFYKIGVVVDDRTSDVCADIHSENKIYKISEAIVGETLPPFHVNCRSRVILMD